MKRTSHETHSRPDELLPRLAEKIVGQGPALAAIVPYVRMFQAGLSPEGRPAGVFFLLGPTGTGKTRTVEALAEVIHGSPRHLVRIDCGEYQMDHEVAKLIGAPPGYLGHRETQPVLTQARLNASTSETSGLSLVLFDEVEKAAPSLHRLLLAVFDKASLRLGDNTVVNFERSLIFLTSNLGARGMAAMKSAGFGLGGVSFSAAEGRRKRETIAGAAARKHFPVEFMNRIDSVITYHPLDESAMEEILGHQIAELQRLIDKRLGSRAFRIEVGPAAREFLLAEGTSEQYGARELKRALHRWIVQPLAELVAGGRVEPGGRARAEISGPGEIGWTTVRARRAPEAVTAA